MSTNGFKSIKITPESDFLVVLGSNGCGKTSLLELVLPNAPSKALFEADGQLNRLYEHKGHQYRLVSGGTTWRHEFYKDDSDNLNQGGTASVQAELIRQEFGVDKDIYDLLTNRTKFSTMAPSIGRRQWITRLNPNDLSYAIDCFKHFNKRFKESRDVARYLDNRIMSETAKQIDLEGTTTIENEIDLIKREINMLMGEISGGGGDETYFHNTLDENKTRLTNISTNILSLVKKIKGFKIHDIVSSLESKGIRDIENHIAELKQHLATEEGLFNHFRREFTDLDNLTDFLHGDVKDVAELEEKLHTLETELELNRRQIQTFMLEGEMDSIIQDSDNCLDHVVDILSDLPSNTDRAISPELLKTKAQALSDVRFQINALENRLTGVHNRLEHILHAKEERCPKCNYTWIDGVGENDVAVCNKQIADMEKMKRELEERVEPLEEEVTRLNDYVSSIRQYKTVTLNYPRLQPLWERISEKGYLFEEPNRIQYIIKQWTSDIRISKIIHAINQEVKILKETLTFSQRIGEQGGWELKDRKETLQRNMEGSIEKIDKINDGLLILNDLLKQLRVLKDLTEEKNNCIKVIKETVPKLIDAIRGNLLKEVLQGHYNRITELQATMNEKLAMDKIIEDLTNSQREVSFDKEVFGIISAALSPNDGLIADSLMGSVYTLVDSMNPILKQLWNKPLVIKPCQNKNGELDYVFPIMVGHNRAGTEIDNDSTGSASQEDVINLAFKLVVIYILDLRDFPLLLDEIGRTFDDLHRVNLMNFIKQLSDSGYFSQIFMINHFQAQYGAFSNAEVVVIDDSNIAVPGSYNKNVVFG